MTIEVLLPFTFFKRALKTQHNPIMGLSLKMIFAITIFLLNLLLKSVPCSDMRMPNPHVFSQMFEDFNMMFEPKEIYIILDPTENKVETQIGLDIIKSKSRRQYVQTIMVNAALDVLESVAIGQIGTVLIVSLTNRASFALSLKMVSYVTNAQCAIKFKKL